MISRPRSFGLLGLGTGCTSPRGQSFALQRTVSVAAALLVAWRVVACGWFGWAFGGVAGVVSFLSSHSFSSNSAALVSVQVRGPCAQSAACGLRIRYVAWSDRLEVQEPYGSASLWGSINWRQVELRTNTHRVSAQAFLRANRFLSKLCLHSSRWSRGRVRLSARCLVGLRICSVS